MCGLSLQCVYRLPLRATVGLLRSRFGLMRVELPVPDSSTLGRGTCVAVRLPLLQAA